MSANIELKKGVVTEITGKIQESKSVVLVHFTGLTVADNVVIRLCPISTCVLHGLDDNACPSNKRFNAALSAFITYMNGRKDRA